MDTDPLIAAMQARHGTLRQDFGLAADVDTWDGSDQYGEAGDSVRFVVSTSDAAGTYTYYGIGYGLLRGFARIAGVNIALVQEPIAGPTLVPVGDLLPDTTTLAHLLDPLPDGAGLAALNGGLHVVFYDGKPVAFYHDPGNTLARGGALLGEIDPADTLVQETIETVAHDLLLAQGAALPQAAFTVAPLQACANWGVKRLPLLGW